MSWSIANLLAAANDVAHAAAPSTNEQLERKRQSIETERKKLEEEKKQFEIKRIRYHKAVVAMDQQIKKAAASIAIQSTTPSQNLNLNGQTSPFESANSNDDADTATALTDDQLSALPTESGPSKRKHKCQHALGQYTTDKLTTLKTLITACEKRLNYPYQCPLCHYRLKTESEYHRHMRHRCPKRHM